MDVTQVTTDILNNPRFQGAIDSISWLTDWVDAGFAMVITLVAFFIISVALLKNVLAGAYCAFPKFWDKVDDAHKQVEGQGWAQQFKATFGGKSQLSQVNTGTFSKALMRILPNIKLLTEFEDSTIGPKQYFMAAIPQMCIVVIIGAFIYNGYYRDVAAKIVDAGSEVFYRAVLEVDPVALYDRITNTAGRPNFSTDGSNDEGIKLQNKAATKVYTTIIGTYNDISSAEAKSQLALQCEDWVSKTLGDPTYATYVGKETWDAKISTDLVIGMPDLSKIHKSESADGLNYRIAFTKPISEFGLSSTKEAGKDWYVRLLVTFEKQAAKDVKSRDLSNVTLKLPNSAFAGTKLTLPGPDTEGFSVTVSGTAKITDSAGNTVNIKSATGKTITIGSGKFENNKSPFTIEGSLYYNDGTNRHKISTIEFSSGVSVSTFSCEGVGDWTYGTKPDFKAAQEAANKANEAAGAE